MTNKDIKKKLKVAYDKLQADALRSAKKTSKPVNKAKVMDKWLDKLEGRYAKGLIRNYLEDMVKIPANDFISAIQFIRVSFGFNEYTEDSQGLKIVIIFSNTFDLKILSGLSDSKDKNRDFPLLESKIAKDFFLKPYQIEIEGKKRDPRESFERLKDKRVDDVKKKMEALGKLSETKNYGNNYEEWLEMKDEIMDSFLELIEKFEGKDGKDNFEKILMLTKMFNIELKEEEKLGSNPVFANESGEPI